MNIYIYIYIYIYLFTLERTGGSDTMVMKRKQDAKLKFVVKKFDMITPRRL